MTTIDIKYYHGDLFDASRILNLPDIYFAHCVSADMKLGAGIAKKFQEKYHIKEQYCRVGSPELEPGFVLRVRKVFNLVTKWRYFHKPTLKTMEDALATLKGMTEDLEVRDLAVPLLGCGLDKLNWEDVEKIFLYTFTNTNLHLHVFLYGREQPYN